MLGPGNYDPECTRARLQAEAKLALLVVLGGRKGGGASIQVHEDTTGELIRLPTILRALADDVERANSGRWRSAVRKGMAT